MLFVLQLITNSPLIMRSWVLGGLPYPSVHLLFPYCKVNFSHVEMYDTICMSKYTGNNFKCIMMYVIIILLYRTWLIVQAQMMVTLFVAQSQALD